VAISVLAGMIARVAGEVSGRVPKVSVLSGGMGAEYSGDNSRMLAEIGGYQFWDLEEAIRDLYGWYERNKEIDVEALRFDEKLDEKATSHA